MIIDLLETNLESLTRHALCPRNSRQSNITTIDSNKNENERK